MARDIVKKKKKPAAKKAKKRAVTPKNAPPSEKQPPKLSQEATKGVEPSPDIPPKLPKLLPLQPRQALFAVEYLVDLNGTQAAIRAGYSVRSARRTATELLSYPHVRAAIDAEIEKQKARITFTADQVMEELARIGFSDMKDFIEIDEGGAIRAFPLDGLAEGKSRIIRKVKEKRVIRTTKGTVDNPDGDQILDSTYEFELCDKVKSLELMARHLGLLHDKQEITGKDGGPIKTTDVTDEELLTIARRSGGRTAKTTESSRKPA